MTLKVIQDGMQRNISAPVKSSVGEAAEVYNSLFYTHHSSRLEIAPQRGKKIPPSENK